MDDTDSPTERLNVSDTAPKDEATEIEVILEPEVTDVHTDADVAAEDEAGDQSNTKAETESTKLSHAKSSNQKGLFKKKPKTAKKSARLAEKPASHTRSASRRFGRLAWTPERQQAVKRSLTRAGKKFLVFMISHVGLTCLVIGYSIIGGFIFQLLEATHEKQERVAITGIRERHVQRLWNVTESLNILHPQRWMNEASIVLREFQRDIYEAVKDKGWDGSDEVNETNLQWTYAGSLLYSVTVITTIGYGHLTPKTTWGRLVTMLYALVGIPMTLQCLSNIGSFMAHCFRLMWKQITCAPCRTRIRRRSLYLAAKQRAALQHNSRLPFVVAAERHSFDGLLNGSRGKVNGCCQGDGQGVDTCPSSKTGVEVFPAVCDESHRLEQKQKQEHTTRFSVSGMLAADHNEQIPSPVGAVRSEELDRSMTPAEIRKAYEELSIAGYEHTGKSSSLHLLPGTELPMSNIVLGYPSNVDPDLNFLTKYQDAMLKKTAPTTHPPEIVRVPITVCLIIAAVYIFLGAMLFTLWEDSWSYFDSSYFCFVTLSTIGFGDIVPGYDTDSWDNQAKRVSCTLYLLFGLALLAMCFELIQSECRQIFATFARAIGFTSDNGV